MVQMMTAPSVHKRYRTKDRPFTAIFPPISLRLLVVEWALERGRLRAHGNDRRKIRMWRTFPETLEVIDFYQRVQASLFSRISSFAGEKGKKGDDPEEFLHCRQLFESYKQDRSIGFFYYDMNNSAQSRQYFEKSRSIRSTIKNGKIS